MSGVGVRSRNLEESRAKTSSKRQMKERKKERASEQNRWAAVLAPPTVRPSLSPLLSLSLVRFFYLLLLPSRVESSRAVREGEGEGLLSRPTVHAIYSSASRWLRSSPPLRPTLTLWRLVSLFLDRLGASMFFASVLGCSSTRSVRSVAGPAKGRASS